MTPGKTKLTDGNKNSFHQTGKALRDKTRSSRPEVFCKKGALRNFAKLTGKHLCQSLFVSKVAGLKKETLVQVLSCEFCEISMNIFFHRTPLVAASVKPLQINKDHLILVGTENLLLSN